MINMKKIHHIGFLAKNLEKTAKDFESMGYERNGGGFDPIQKAEILFMNMDGVNVELVVPSEDSEVYPLLKKYRNAPYHICYDVENLEQAIEEFVKQGYALFRPAVKAVAISETARVAFLMGRNVGMVELVEL